MLLEDIRNQQRYIPVDRVPPPTIRGPVLRGGIALPLPTGRSVVSPRAGVIPPSTLAPASAFGGRNGGMGTAAAAAPTALGPATLTGLGSSLSKAGVGITNTLGTFIPLAIKIILAVIVVKIVLWLVKGRR